MRPALRPIALATLGALALPPTVACSRPPAPAADVVIPQEQVGVGDLFRVGVMEYQVRRARAVRSIARRPNALVAPAGSVFVIVAFERVWHGENPFTVTGMPLEFVAADGRRITQDLDATSANVLASNCGELGPVRVFPGTPVQSCAIFVAPEAALVGAFVEPSRQDHRGLPRPRVRLGSLPVEP